MAIPIVKATYSLDVSTVKTLERMAKRWVVSKSEALRRAIRAAAANDSPDGGKQLARLDELQRKLALDPAKASRWVREVKAERAARSPRPAKTARR